MTATASGHAMPAIEKHKIVRLHNQGSDIGTKGVLFIDWDDGVSTALGPEKWTCDYLTTLEMARQHSTPIDRVGSFVGGVASDPQITLGCTSQAQASRVANWYRMWMP